MMNKENSFAAGDYIAEQTERLSPLEKVISSENLSYLPNLYFRKYKLIESLNYERYQFPEQKVLIPRQKTSWDALLSEMSEKAQLRIEMQKFKVAQNYHITKEAKDEFIKKELKKEERELFHRIIANQLAEQVRDSFAKFKPKDQTKNHVNGSIIQGDQKQEESKKKGRNEDQIFINSEQPQEQQRSQERGFDDVFDDLLNDGLDQKEPTAGMLPGSNVNGDKGYDAQRPNKSIREYISSYIQLQGKETTELSDEVMDEENQQRVSDKNHLISRKQCLKRINQNLRKRLKTKVTQADDRSLTSATVSLSNLINNYPQTKIGQGETLVELPNKTEWIFDQSSRPKRRKDEDFQLKWPKQEVQRFYLQNGDKFQLNKIKDSAVALQLFLQAKEYPRLFQKNISSDQRFPSSLRQVREFSQKFHKRKFYYNQFHDRAYQRFVMRNNKRKLLSKFQANANYMFAEHYVQEEIQDNEKISMGKMFLYPPSKLSQRVIYKVSPGTTKVTAIAKGYNKKSFPMSREKTILMSFLMQKYLAQFGNNWKAITQFIQIFPSFSNYLIRPQLIQEVYQLINRHELKTDNLDNLEIWDKKLLPSQQIYKESYKDLRDLQKEKNAVNGVNLRIELQFQSQTVEDETIKDEKVWQGEETDILPQDYEQILSEPLQSRQSDQKVFKHLARKYKEYGKKLFSRTTNETYNFYENKVQKANKTIDQYSNTFLPVKVESPSRPDNADQVIKFAQEVMKPEVKTGLPFRKKKNINQRNNELVKILQALKSKNSMQPGQSKGNQINKNPGMINNKIMMSGHPMTHMASSQSLVNKGADSQGQKQQKKSKAPEKRVGGSVKKRKKQGQEEKK